MKQKSDSVIKAVFRGLRLDVDIVPIVSNFIYKGERYGYEAGVYADLKHKYFPALEIGFAGANKTSAEGLIFKTSGLYGRVGVDLNLIKPKKDRKPINNVFFAGVRLGFSPFSYSFINVIVPNAYWGSNITQDLTNIQTTKVWGEIVAGMRVEVFKNTYMGWTVRNKKLLGTDIPGELSPWYVPGFGVKGEGSGWGINYSIGYKF